MFEFGFVWNEIRWNLYSYKFSLYLFQITSGSRFYKIFFEVKSIFNISFNWEINYFFIQQDDNFRWVVFCVCVLYRIDKKKIVFFCVVWLQLFRLTHCFFLLIQYKHLLVRNGNRVVTSQKWFIWLWIFLVELIFWMFYVCLLFIANYSHIVFLKWIHWMAFISHFESIITRLLNMLIKEMFRTVVYLEYKRILYHWLMLPIE